MPRPELVAVAPGSGRPAARAEVGGVPRSVRRRVVVVAGRGPHPVAEAAPGRSEAAFEVIGRAVRVRDVPEHRDRRIRVLGEDARSGGGALAPQSPMSPAASSALVVLRSSSPPHVVAGEAPRHREDAGDQSVARPALISERARWFREHRAHDRCADEAERVGRRPQVLRHRPRPLGDEHGAAGGARPRQRRRGPLRTRRVQDDDVRVAPEVVQLALRRAHGRAVHRAPVGRRTVLLRAHVHQRDARALHVKAAARLARRGGWIPAQGDQQQT